MTKMFLGYIDCEFQASKSISQASSSNYGCSVGSTTDLSVQAPIAMIRKVRSNDLSQRGYGSSAGEQENMTSSAEIPSQ